MKSFERIYPLSTNQIETQMPSYVSVYKNRIADSIKQIELQRLSGLWTYSNRVVDSILAETEKRTNSNERRFTGMITINPRPDQPLIARYLTWGKYNNDEVTFGYSFCREFPDIDEPTQFSLQSFRDSISINSCSRSGIQIIKESESPSILGILNDRGSYFVRPNLKIQFDGYTIP